MGAQLVGRVYAFAAKVDLKPNEFRLLAFMAHTAKDTDPEPRYYGSREKSAFALGRLVPDEPEFDDPSRERIITERNAAFQRVKVALAGLVSSGAVRRARGARAGVRTAVYLITIDSILMPSTTIFSSEHVPKNVRKTNKLSSDRVPDINRNAYP